MKREAHNVKVKSCQNEAIKTGLMSSNSVAMAAQASHAPIKSGDVVDAIRRQRQTKPMVYGKSHNSMSHPVRQPAFRALISGVIPPNFNRNTPGFSNIFSPCSGAPLGDNCIGASNDDGNGIYNCGLNIQSVPYSNGSPSNGNNIDLSPKEGASVGGYSVVFDKYGRMTTIINNKNNRNSQDKKLHYGQPAMSTGKPSDSRRQVPKLTLTHRGKKPLNTQPLNNTPDSVEEQIDRFNRALFLGSRSPRNKSEKHLITLSDSECTFVKNLNKQPFKGGRRLLTKIPSKSDITLPLHPGFKRARTSIDSPLGQPDNGNSSLTCEQLADRILSSSDLGHMSHLCSRRQPYAEFIEQQEPHRLRTDTSDKHTPSLSPPSQPPSSPTLPSPISLFSSFSLSSNRASSTSKSSHVPNNGNTGQNASGVAYSAIDAISSAQTQSSNDSEIDYDKPITIIIETNDDIPSKWTKPILKPINPRLGTAQNLHRGTETNDCNVTPQYLDSYASLNQEASFISYKDRNSAKPSSGKPSGAYPSGAKSNEALTIIGSNKGRHIGETARDKARLVRFSVDNTIHEFLPFDPIDRNSAANQQNPP